MAANRWDHRSAFFWNSKLSDKRKDEIIDWLQTLDPNHVKMVEELASDAEQDAVFDHEETEDYYG